MSYALQIWWSEYCSEVDKSLAIRENNLIQRMINWKVVKPKPRYEDFMEDMFSKVDMKFNELQMLMIDHYIGIVKVVKEGSTSYDKVAHSLVHESEKYFPDREVNPPQSHNEHNTDAKSENIIEDVGQSSKVGSNKGGADKRVKEADREYTDKVEEEEISNTVAEIDKGLRDERLKEAEEDLHNIADHLHKAIALVVAQLSAAYPTGITNSQLFITDSAMIAIDTCNLQGNTNSQSYISDSPIAAMSQVLVCKTNLSNVIKKLAQGNKQYSKLYQSPYINVFYSGSKDKVVIQSCKNLNYSFEGHNIYGTYAEELFSKFSL
ncbi:hypothetical protein T459_28325 [Capsicum annuum]|uniref:Uncharacterized protein n=1 Tax=Capsicum annuum TaxID=4072 RepID=A0A2G2YGG0_CAPAN|nr:hypothetical protein T459_28325 [Capsicum annuum]